MADFAAGEGPAGHDPVVPGETLVGDAADALLYDLESRTFVTDADGGLVAEHPVDAAVALAIGFELGSIAADADRGLNLGRLRRVPRKAAASVTADAIKVALQILIDAGDITLDSVVLEPTPRGTLAAVADYRNLRLSPPKRTRITVTS